MDKVRELLLKVKALADKGVAGEKESATAMLSKLCDIHGVDISTLDSDVQDYYLVRFKSKPYARELAFQVYRKVCDISGDFTYKHPRRSKTSVYLMMTSAQYVEFQMMYDFYMRLFNDEMDIFFSSFINAQNLFADTEDENKERREMTDRDRRVLSMMDTIDVKTPHKQLN